MNIFTGSSTSGETLGINSRYFFKNDKPWYPIMGEFHHSRYPVKYWEESLCKMRACGIQIVAFYTFWIYHEEEKGKWDFSGQRDLRRFIELCYKLNFPIFLRIGPWAHGECRNGGLPDWLQNDSTIKIRTNDPVYLDHVRNFYKKIYEAAKGFLWKDGGPVIGIQIENEYGHVGGLSGDEGFAHMRALKKIAVETGFDVPFYTATGWGGAIVVDGEMLPVQFGYADAPWEKHTNKLDSIEHFLLTPFGKDTQEVFTYNVDNNPYLTAEIGGGIQVTVDRRPVVSAADTAAMALCKLATGANLLGYYMFHGGTHPAGKLTPLHETTATGSWSELPVLTYDFQACIGEYGELHQSYKKLKKLHLFLNCFGDLVAPSESVFPENIVKDAADTETLRYCTRHDKKSNTGFLFINNHQRHRNMKNHKDINISVALPEETICFPAMNIPAGFFGMFPYNIKLGGSLLKSTNAQLLCKMGETYVFYCHEKPVFNYGGKACEASTAPVIVLTEEEADNTWLFDDKLYITKGDLLKMEEKIYLTTCRTEETVTCYKNVSDKKTFQFKFDPVQIGSSFKEIYRDDDYAEYEIRLDKIPTSIINDMFMNIDFTGDRAELYRGGVMIADWYTTGLPWRPALHRFDYEEHFTLKVYPIVREIYFECEIKKGYELYNISLQAQYRININ